VKNGRLVGKMGDTSLAHFSFGVRNTQLLNGFHLPSRTLNATVYSPPLLVGNFVWNITIEKT
jgi:hypothetical protein